MGPLSPRTEAIWWVQRICVRDLIHQLPSDVGSLLIVRISYDQKKQKASETPSSIFSFWGEGLPSCATQCVPE